MEAEEQIALWTQRRLQGKLHLPRLTGQDLDSLAAVPLCGRQLNNHRAQRSQLAGSLPEFTYQLLSGKGCRHCAKQSGLLLEIEQAGEDPSDEENDL